MTKGIARIFALVAAVSLPSAAETTLPGNHDAGQHVVPANTSVALTEGEIRKVDKDAGKLTIRHGPLENLGMPAMTMVYRVKDPAMLDQVKQGDKIEFIAEEIGGQLTVTRLHIRK